jgi:hypothetical protein
MREPPYKFMVRLPASMRDLIEQSARHYRRSLNSDIVARLQHSFSGLPDQKQETGLAPPLHDQFDFVFRRDLSEEEEMLIRGFRGLSAAKREALLSLLL